MDHPEIREVSALAQEVDSLTDEVEALEARLADVKEQRDHSQDRYLSHRAQYERICDGLRAALRVQNDLALERLRRAERYRSRLALALRTIGEDRRWAGVHYGGVWSRRALDKKGEMK